MLSGDSSDEPADSERERQLKEDVFLKPNQVLIGADDYWLKLTRADNPEEVTATNLLYGLRVYLLVPTGSLPPFCLANEDNHYKVWIIFNYNFKAVRHLKEKHFIITLYISN